MKDRKEKTIESWAEIKFVWRQLGSRGDGRNEGAFGSACWASSWRPRLGNPDTNLRRTIARKWVTLLNSRINKITLPLPYS